MLAAIIQKPEVMELCEVQKPVLSEGEALIRVLYTGVCGTDVHLLHGWRCICCMSRGARAALVRLLHRCTRCTGKVRVTLRMGGPIKRVFHLTADVATGEIDNALQFFNQPDEVDSISVVAANRPLDHDVAGLLKRVQGVDDGSWAVAGRIAQR